MDQKQKEVLEGAAQAELAGPQLPWPSLFHAEPAFCSPPWQSTRVTSPLCQSQVAASTARTF